MKKILTAICIGVVITLSACGTQTSTEIKTEDFTLKDSTISTKVEALSSEASSEEDPPSDCQNVINEELGFSFPLSNYYANILKNNGTETYEDYTFGKTLRKVSYYLDLGDIQEPVFVIYELDKIYSASEVEDLNPMMLYLGENSTNSFGIMYSPEPSENLTGDNYDTVEFFMNNEAKDIPSAISFN